MVSSVDIGPDVDPESVALQKTFADMAADDQPPAPVAHRGTPTPAELTAATTHIHMDHCGTIARPTRGLHRQPQPARPQHLTTMAPDSMSGGCWRPCASSGLPTAGLSVSGLHRCRAGERSIGSGHHDARMSYQVTTGSTLSVRRPPRTTTRPASMTARAERLDALADRLALANHAQSSRADSRCGVGGQQKLPTGGQPTQGRVRSRWVTVRKLARSAERLICASVGG
jgi:hypothetical protein